MIAGVHFVKSQRKGGLRRWYVYAWRGGPQIMKAQCYARPRLDAVALELLSDAHKQSNIVRVDTLAGLIRQWWPRSPEWTALAPNTQKTWSSALTVIEAKWGATPTSFWSNPKMVSKVVLWRDSRASTPRAADTGVTVLKALLEFARIRGLVSLNVAAGIRRIYGGGDRAEIIWTSDDIAAFERVAPTHISDGLHLAALTGLRRADLVALKWTEVKDTSIVRKALKSSRGKRRHAIVPIIPELRALLELLRARPRNPNVETVLVNSQGNPWTGDGFGGSFNRVRDEAGIVQEDGRKKHLHDVRGTFATNLILAGATDREIADVMAWSPDQVAGIRRVYVDQTRVIVAVGNRINDAAVKRPVKH